MKTHPILFSTEMVQAILAGRKTQTRRVSKHQCWSHSELIDVNINGIFQKVDRNVSCPYGKPGDLLWVRESFVKFETFNETLFSYKASPKTNLDVNWKPSIHMPKDAARIWLRITNIRVERLKNITHEDALAEGILDFGDGTYKNYFKNKGLRTQDGVECILPIASFQSLWCSINGNESWEANPWVWVIEYEVLSTTGFNAIAEDIRKEVAV